MRINQTVIGKLPCSVGSVFLSLTAPIVSGPAGPSSCQPPTHPPLAAVAEVGGPPGTFLGLVKLVWVPVLRAWLVSGLRGREFLEKEMVVVRQNDGATSRGSGWKAPCSW